MEDKIEPLNSSLQPLKEDILTDVDNINNTEMEADANADAESNPMAQSTKAPINSESLPKDFIVKFHATLPPPPTEAATEAQPILQKMPRYTYVETAEYNPNTFVQTMTEKDLMNEQSRNEYIRRLKDTVRWRLNADGTKQSNAKIRLWSDGSETFHMGAESFDVMRQPLPQSNIQLCSRHGSCYRPRGAFEEKLTFRPRLDSEHVKGLRDRTVNKPQTGGVKVIVDVTHKACKNADQLAKQELSRLFQEERKMSSSSVKKRMHPHPRTADDDIDLNERDNIMEDDDEEQEEQYDDNEGFSDEAIDKEEDDDDDDTSVCTSIAVGIAKLKRIFNVDSDSE